MNKQIKAFTLVELIVVITILAILVSISFVSLKGYLANARDAKRYNDITELYKKIQNEMVLNQKLNITDFMTGDIQELTGNITMYGKAYTGLLIGDINFENLKEKKENFQENIEGLEDYKIAIIPKTGYYAIIADMETEDTIPQASRFLTDEEYKMIVGDFSYNDLLAGGEVQNPPIPEDVCLNGDYSGNNYDRKCGNCNMSATANRSGSGDIVVGGYTMMDRNLGATSDDYTSTGSYGCHFQWGRNKGFDSVGDIELYSSQLDGSVGLNASTDTYGFVFNTDIFNLSIAHPWSWTYTDITNNWGGSGDTIEQNGPGTDLDRQGPCPSGYHIPSVYEWKDLLTNWSISKGGNCYNHGLWMCLGVETTAMQADFKLPYAGNRFGTDETDVGYYLSSSSYYYSQYNIINPISMLFSSSSSVFPAYSSELASSIFGQSIRCFKN